MSQPFHRSKLTAEVVRELLHYDPDTGLFIWKERARRWFPHEDRWNAWNSTFAGKPALTAIAGYCAGQILGVPVRAHRVAYLYMAGGWPRADVDHVNGVRTDNRWDNLREASRSQNCANTRIHRDNKSGFKGVVWSEPRQKWQARICVDGRTICLGRFNTLPEAREVYAVAAVKHFGEFAYAG